MRAVITVVGKDMVGIVATVATECAATNANILDVTQSVFEDDIFAMVMLVDVSKLSRPLPELSDRLNALTKDVGLVVHVMHEDIFNSMHRI